MTALMQDWREWNDRLQVITEDYARQDRGDGATNPALRDLKYLMDLVGEYMGEIKKHIDDLAASGELAGSSLRLATALTEWRGSLSR
jgi:hypothetical protein